MQTWHADWRPSQAPSRTAEGGSWSPWKRFIYLINIAYFYFYTWRSLLIFVHFKIQICAPVPAQTCQEPSRSPSLCGRLLLSPWGFYWWLLKGNVKDIYKLCLSISNDKKSPPLRNLWEGIGRREPSRSLWSLCRQQPWRYLQLYFSEYIPSIKSTILFRMYSII